MADKAFHSLAAKGKGISTWDVENILTKAVYRALNINNQFAHVLDSQLPVSVDKRLTTSDPHLQLRLVAEKLCARVERRYEKRLLQQREHDRADTDRKLADIRAEYSEQLEMRRRDLDRERIRLEEQYAQKDRDLRHRIDLELSEKESALEITRKSLETRLTELTLQKEHLDRIKAEFHAKFAADVEMLNREWERVNGRKEELRAFYRQEFENDQQKLLERSLELEKENAVFKKKLGECGAELNQMRSQLAIFANMKEDLKNANERIRKEVEENHRLSRYSYEAGRLKEENMYLKEELEHLKSFADMANDKRALKNVKQSPEDLYSTKLNELKMIIKIMGNKISSLTSERDYLREILRCSHKDLSRVDSRMRKTNADHLVITSPASCQTVKDKDSCEDTSVSSTLSASGSDLQKIKKRFSILDELARTLDTKIDCVSASHSFTQNRFGASSVSQADSSAEFCRSLKAEVTEDNHAIKEVFEEVVENPSPGYTINCVSGLHCRRQKADMKAPQGFESSNGYRLVTSKKCDSTAAMKEMIVPIELCADTGTSSSFFEKLKARNELSRKLKFCVPSTEDEEARNRNKMSKHESNSAADERVTLALKLDKVEEEQKTDFTRVISGAENSSNTLELDDSLVGKGLDYEDEIEW